MITINPQFITDNTGKKLSVILPVEEFNAIMEELDEIEDIHLYDNSKKNDEPSIPIDEAFKEIEANRNKK